MRRTIAALAMASMAASGAFGQSLHERPQPAAGLPRMGEAPAATDGAPSVVEMSLTSVQPPAPREFMENDLVTIIISERSSMGRDHEFETKKKALMGGEINSSIDLMKVLEARLEQGRTSEDDLPVWEVALLNDFKGEAEYTRDDEVTARVTARVVEVKPNGTLLLEARTAIKTDYEQQTILLSGVCRGEDVTISNTVQSNQMHDLRVDIQHTGEVRKGAEKGLITKVIDALFAY